MGPYCVYEVEKNTDAATPENLVDFGAGFWQGRGKGTGVSVDTLGVINGYEGVSLTPLK